MWQSAEKALAVIAAIREEDRERSEAKPRKALGLVPHKQDPRLTVAQLDRAVWSRVRFPPVGHCVLGFFKPVIKQVEARTAVEMP